MSRDLERQRQFTRRALLLAGGQSVLLAVLGVRLYHLQVEQSDRYMTLAEDNRINLRLLPPPRGFILDRRGRPLATNQLDYRVVVVAEQAGDVERTLLALSQIVAVSDTDVRRVLREMKRKRKFVPVTIRENLSWEDVARIEVQTLDLPGISIEAGETRSYPHDRLLSHVLGYVAPVSEEDQNNDPLLQLPGFRIGKAGIEKVYDRSLRGSAGRSQVEVNAVGRVIRELNRKEGQPGANVTLTLDLELQQFAYDRFGDEVGSAVVIDVQTGDVLAIVSNPGYDPNIFTRGLTAQEWRELVRSPRGPLINKAITGQYAPGSTFKPVVALAGLERGAMTPATRISCRGKVALGNAEFHCWRRGGHGSVDLKLGIVQSCDCYFYEVARRTGVDAISAMANRLGLGMTTGIDLPSEKPGVMPTRAWKEARMGGSWHQGETLVAGIGQGYVLTTPLQLAVMTARLANGSFAVSPRLVRDAPAVAAHGGPRVQPPFERLQVNPVHLRLVQDAMDAVVNAGNGTAKSSAIRDPSWLMAGKTGTSQVRRITRAERATGVKKNEHLPWERRDHALFIGYAPLHAPKFAVAVIVEHGGGGSKAAAPIARDILMKARELDAVRPAGPVLRQASVAPPSRRNA
jgi:penicillin-binding protein 2